MEYSVLGAAVVATRLDPYAAVIRHAEDGMLICPDEWYGVLKHLIENEGVRRKLGQRARQAVLERHSWLTQKGRWQGWLRGFEV